MRIFATGVDGYIGSVLASMLIKRGHDVVGLDTGLYREGWLYNNGATRLPTVHNMDLRNITEVHLKGFDAVVHLAELSNDPLGQHNPELTYRINHLGTVALAQKAKAVGVKRFVYTSSCSIYGTGSGEFKNEESEPNPQTAYASCKLLVERDLKLMADDGFSPTFLRNATAYGPSPRIRFDLVLNNLAGLAFTTRKIAMTSDGSPWRPLVHVADICEAIACVLEAERGVVHKEIFNVGNTKENYQVRDIANIVASTIPGCEVTVGSNDGDNRSYRVSFDKIARQIPAFKCQRTAKLGAQQLAKLFERIQLSKEMFEFRAYTRLKELKYLIETKQLNDELYWTAL